MPTPTRLLRRMLLGLGLGLPLAAAAQQLTVSAAASLTDAFKEIGQRFEAGTPGTTVRLNLAASGVLIQQITQGAPVDVLASADQETMNRGVDRKLIDPQTRRDFTANTLVLIVPAQDGPAVAKVGDLGQPTVRRIAIGKPASVPAGRYTKQALESAGAWTALEPKFVYADSVRQVLDYVARGEAEAGFVYRSDAATMAGKVKVVQTVEGHAPVTYPIAVVSESRQKALARDFIAFVGGAPGQAILAKFGFAQP